MRNALEGRYSDKSVRGSFDDDGDGAVVHQRDFHLRAEYPTAYGEAFRFEELAEAVEEWGGDFGASGVGEGGATAFGDVGVEGELRNGENRSADVGEGEVHFTVVVLEQAHSCNFAHCPDDSSFVVVVSEASQHEEAALDLADDLTVNRY